MEINGKTVLVCDCEGTMPLDAKALAKALGVAGLELNTQLCRAQLGNFQRAVIGDAPVLVACTQEAPLFEETREDSNPNNRVAYTNIRERAGWADEAKAAAPKIAALLAEAALEVAPTPGLTLKSEGAALVYGRDESAVEAARRLATRLDVTVLLTAPDDVLPPRIAEVPVFRGTIRAARGHLGAFELVIDDHAPVLPSSKAALAFEESRNEASSSCDLILDLTGGAPLFPASETRDGYFRPDPGDPVQLERALFDIADMVGEFEKPRYVKYNAEICAHSRSRVTGCTRCLEVCPASAIEPDGDHVVIDPFACGGCGNCASVCPTGAATYDMPPVASLFERLRTLLSTYRAAGGEAPLLLVHDPRHGEEMIAMMARAGRGLPARAIPFAVNETTQVGLDFLLSAIAYGASQVRLLAGPANRDRLDGLAGQVALAEAALAGLGYGQGRVGIIDEADPEALEAALHGLAPQAPPKPGSFLPMGAKRTLVMLALRHLHAEAPEPVELLPLADGAPFGAVEIDAGGCTLCLSCVGACPTGALVDNPETPELSFSEDACVQCGLCRTTCPESVMRLVPRFNFAEEARGARVLKAEEPFECIRCAKPFTTKSSIDIVIKRLEGHSMFSAPGALDRVKMCEDCRVMVQFETADNPLAGAARPLPRTTDDDLAEREAALQAERRTLRTEAEAAIAERDGGEEEDGSPGKGNGKGG